MSTTCSSGSWNTVATVPASSRRMRRPRVQAADDDAPGEAAAVEVRHEPGQSPEQRRLARARGAEQRDELARLDLERDVVDRRTLGARIGERQVLDRR